MATSSITAKSTIPTPTALTLPASQQALLQPYLPPSDPKTCTLTLTYAQSLDASISLSPGTQTVLSGPETKAMTHFLRSRHAAILVGVGTAEADDPGLNCRFADALTTESDGESVITSSQPRPVILDPSGRWSCRADAKVLRLAREGAGKAPLWMVSAENAAKVPSEKIKILEAAGGEFLARDEFWEDCGVQWGVILKRLWVTGIESVMVEGGGRVIKDLLKSENREMVDSVIITIAPVWLGAGGVDVVPVRNGEAEVGRMEGVKWIQMGEDVVMAGKFKLPRTEDEKELGPVGIGSGGVQYVFHRD